MTDRYEWVTHEELSLTNRVGCVLLDSAEALIATRRLGTRRETWVLSSVTRGRKSVRGPETYFQTGLEGDVSR